MRRCSALRAPAPAMPGLESRDGECRRGTLFPWRHEIRLRPGVALTNFVAPRKTCSMTRGRKPLGGKAMTVAERSRRYRDSRREAGAAEMDALRERIAALEAEVAALRTAPAPTPGPPPNMVLVASDRASRVVAAIAKEQNRWTRRRWRGEFTEADAAAWDQLPGLILWLWQRASKSLRLEIEMEFQAAHSWVCEAVGGHIALVSCKNPFLVDDPAAEAKAGLPEIPPKGFGFQTVKEQMEGIPRFKPVNSLSLPYVKELVHRRRTLRQEAERTVEVLRQQRARRESGE